MLLASVPSLVAAPPSVHDALPAARLVEGHVVHLVLGDAPITGGLAIPRGTSYSLRTWGLDDGEGTPREYPGVPHVVEYFPGVRWFNDQFVLDPLNNSFNPSGSPLLLRTQFATGAAILVGEPDGQGGTRYPCNGAVLMVPAGAPDPRTRLSGATYEYSYLTTDPNDHKFVTDAWSDAQGDIFVTPILNNADRMARPMDESTCAPYTDNVFALSPGADSRPYPGRESVPPRGIQYNAYLTALVCDARGYDPCPKTGRLVPHGHNGERATDDARAGNAHPHDPWTPILSKPYVVHGSDGALYPNADHLELAFDVYYGQGPNVASRQLRVVDTEGSLAPFG